MRGAFSFLFIGILWVLAQQASAGRSPRKCPAIEIDNGKARIKSRGRVAKFKCRKGYQMFEGDKFATCVKGRWNGKIPKCIKPGCHYQTIPNGEAVHMYNDAFVQFYCSPGYVLEGASALTCDGSGWNDTVPECKAPRNVVYNCSFESDSICGWSNGDHDEFDWTRNKGPSSSFGTGTGPQVDHTLGTVLGHYMYIDSAVSRDVGDKARLYSPVYPGAFTDNMACFAFYYHMVGDARGHLNVYMKGEEDDIDYLAPVYQMELYNQGQWVLIVVHLHQIETNFQIVIEASMPDGYMSDIAIDDVKLTNGDECHQLDDEAMAQYDNGVTTTTTPVETILLELTTSLSVGGQSPPTVLQSTTEPGTTSLVTNTSSGMAQSSTVSVSILPSGTTPAAVETTESDNLGSSTTPSVSSSTAGHLESTSTTISSTGRGSEEDLSSCRNRCGEIAMDADTCGCDIECSHNHSCCSDVHELCDGYHETLPPTTIGSTISPLSTSASPATIATLNVTVESVSSTDLHSSFTDVPLSYNTTASTAPEVTTLVEERTTLETKSDNVSISQIQTSVAPNSSTEIPSKEPSTTIVPTTIAHKTTTAIKTTEGTTTELTTTTAETTSTVKTTSTAKPASIAKTSTAGTTLPIETTTEDITIRLFTDTVTSTISESFTTVFIDNTTINSSSVPEIAGSAAPSKGSNTVTYVIVTFTLLVILAILTVVAVAYIRKKRRDKLPEDSDIQFLARDEIMMEGNIFNLSGTLSQARNSAI